MKLKLNWTLLDTFVFVFKTVLFEILASFTFGLTGHMTINYQTNALLGFLNLDDFGYEYEAQLTWGNYMKNIWLPNAGFSVVGSFFVFFIFGATVLASVDVYAETINIMPFIIPILVYMLAAVLASVFLMFLRFNAILESVELHKIGDVEDEGQPLSNLKSMKEI